MCTRGRFAGTWCAVLPLLEVLSAHAMVRKGHCGVTEGSGVCEIDLQGSWELNSTESSSVSAAQGACTRRCEQCRNCNYVSFSTSHHDCSWFVACEPKYMVQDGAVAETFHTVKVKAKRASKTTQQDRLEFLEIGTSNFNTLVGSSYPGPGKSVEALKFYQDDLPDRSGVEKVNAAVVSERGLLTTKNITFYFVHPKNISRFSLHSDFKGMNSITTPHPEVVRQLQRLDLMHLLESVQVPTTSYVRLVEGTRSIGFVKLDIEGGEPGVLDDLVSECRKRQLCPDQVLYEHKYIRNPTHVLGSLRKAGYTCSLKVDDTRCTFDKAYAA